MIPLGKSSRIKSFFALRLSHRDRLTLEDFQRIGAEVLPRGLNIRKSADPTYISCSLL
jgi:hypothetical protein